MRPDDYDVIQAGEIVGRIYRMKADRELWRWMPPGPSGGVSGHPRRGDVGLPREVGCAGVTDAEQSQNARGSSARKRSKPASMGYGANGPFYQLAAVLTGRGAGMDRVWWLH
jgi:hypothetical protein